MATYTSRAIARFGGATNVSSSAGTTTTWNLPASIPKFAVIILIVSYNGPVTITTPSGYTLIRKSQQQSSPTFKASTVSFMKYADGTESSTVATTTTTSLDWTAIAQVYTGGTESDGSPALLEFLVDEDAAGEDNAALDTTIATPSATYVAADYGLWRLSHFNEVSSAGNTWTAASNTERADVTSSGVVTKTSSAFYDSNAAITSGTSTSVTGTSSNSLGGARVASIYLLRMGKGGTVTNENVSPTDASRRFERTSVRTDNLGLTDAGTGKSQTRVRSDIAFLFADGTRSIRQTKGKTEALGLTDANKFFSQTKDRSDSTGVTDTRGISQSHTRSDTEGLTDAGTGKTQSKAKTDTEGLTDTSAETQTKGFSDLLAETDTSSKSLQKVRTDTEALTDTLGKTQSKGKTDTENLTDSRSFGRGKVVDDPTGLVDTRSFSQTHQYLDNEPITDPAGVNQSKQFSDDEDLSDITFFGRGFVVVDTETLEDLDLVGPFSRLHIVGGGGVSSKTYILTITDGMDMAESQTGHIDTRYETFSDECQLEDCFDLVLIRGRSTTLVVSDGMGLTDSIAIEDGRDNVSETDTSWLIDNVTIFKTTPGGGTEQVFYEDLSLLTDTFLASIDPGAEHVVTATDSAGLTDSALNNQDRVNVSNRMRLRDSFTVTLLPEARVVRDKLRLRDRYSIELIPPDDIWRSIGEDTR